MQQDISNEEEDEEDEEEQVAKDNSDEDDDGSSTTSEDRKIHAVDMAFLATNDEFENKVRMTDVVKELVGKVWTL